MTISIKLMADKVWTDSRFPEYNSLGKQQRRQHRFLYQGLNYEVRLMLHIELRLQTIEMLNLGFESVNYGFKTEKWDYKIWMSKIMASLLCLQCNVFNVPNLCLSENQICFKKNNKKKQLFQLCILGFLTFFQQLGNYIKPTNYSHFSYNCSSQFC